MKTQRILWPLAALLLALAIGVTYAQDDGGDGPIEPATTNTPTPTVPAPTPTVGPPTVTVTAVPATTTPLPTVTATPVFAPPQPTAAGPTAAATAPAPRAVVAFESVFIRELPAPDAVVVASGFRDDTLEIIGRNADGRWLQVRRPGRANTLGWIAVEVIDYDVPVETLPLTDTTTGVTGPVPIPPDAQFAVFISEGPALRTLPDRQLGERILNIPPSVVVPVTARYRDGAWLQVNYLGNEGWIIGFVIRERDGVLDLPEITGLLPADNAPEISAVVIPPEIQLEKLEEIRAFTTARLTVAQDLANFWFLVQQGEVLPCNPPPTVDEYRYSGADVQILPEIDRYVPRLNEGIGFLNTSLDVLDRCGVVDPFDVQQARNDAINARLIMTVTLDQLERLEDLIR